MFSWFKKILTGGGTSIQDCFTAVEKESLGALDGRIVVGKILQIDPHPDPKITKVRVTQTKIGEETVQILCGAQNIEEGMIVPVATIGTDLGGGFIISERAIRNVTSCGMICSQKELNISEEDNGGIWALNPALESKLGTPLKDFA